MGLRLMGSCLLCLMALLGCRQVLGIESAQLAASAGASGLGGGAGSAAVSDAVSIACNEEPVGECVNCMHACGVGAQSATDHVYRLELDKFKQCLGKDCSADQEACFMKVGDATLKDCLASCAPKCGQTSPVAQCELYCGCMLDYCSTEADPLGDCMTKCETLPPEVRDCRRDHCEFGKGAVSHCQHASDEQHVCQSFDELMKPTRHICLDRKESTWACDQNSECCSRKCAEGACE